MALKRADGSQLLVLGTIAGLSFGLSFLFSFGLSFRSIVLLSSGKGTSLEVVQYLLPFLDCQDFLGHELKLMTVHHLESK